MAFASLASDASYLRKGVIGLVRRTGDWQELHGQGQCARALYFFCGAAIILGLF